MDSLTQAVLGAACGELVLGKKVGNKAILWGAVAGTLPDLDVLFTPFFHPVDGLFVHRGYSHTLLFAFVTAPLLAWLITKIYRGKYATFREWTRLAFWATLTHPLLDAFTGYGTPLFMPFSDYRVAINSIFIVDPFYTLPFLICVIMAARARANYLRRAWWNRLGLIVSTSYLSLTFASQQWIEHECKNYLKETGRETSRYVSIPTPFNCVLYGFLAESEEGYYIGYRSLFDKTDSIHFSWVPANRELISKWMDEPKILKLRKFSKEFYAVREENGELYFSDLRFGMAGGWSDPLAPFVFSFKLIPLPDGSVDAEKGDWRGARMSALGSLWERIKGV